MTMATPTKFKETEIGLIPEEWGVSSVYDTVDILGGGTPDTSNSDYWGGDIPWLSVTDFNNGSRFVYDTEKKITERGLNESNTQILKKNQIIISARGTVGMIAQLGRDMTFNQSCYGITGKNGMSNDFLFYLLKNYVSDFKQKSHGAVFDTITRETFKNVPVPIPSKIEQESIAEILSSLDDKIELNRKINANLEKLASSLFKKWFVDIGDELPEGWRLGTFGEAVINFDSKRIPLSSREREKRQGTYPYYGATSIMDYVDDFIFDGTYVLLGEDGSVAKDDGKPFVQYVNGKIWVNNHAHVLQGKNGFSTEYIKIFLDQVDIMPFVTGAVQPKLNQANMNSVPMIIPDQKTLGKFNEILTALFGMILENEGQTKNLEQVRDSLLPRLMSGKIRVNI